MGDAAMAEIDQVTGRDIAATLQVDTHRLERRIGAVMLHHDDRHAVLGKLLQVGGEIGRGCRDDHAIGDAAGEQRIGPAGAPRRTSPT
jgi:hypothetical protein